MAVAQAAVKAAATTSASSLFLWTETAKLMSLRIIAMNNQQLSKNISEKFLYITGHSWPQPNPSMKFIMFIYLKTSSMKVNWKQLALYILRIIELVITGAAGGAITQL